jgi:hypothetical protein
MMRRITTNVEITNPQHTVAFEGALAALGVDGPHEATTYSIMSRPSICIMMSLQGSLLVLAAAKRHDVASI